MKKLIFLLLVLFVTLGYSQTDRLWSSVSAASGMRKANAAGRASFPADFKLRQLDLNSFRQVLKGAPDKFSGNKGVIVSIPNAEGDLERFEMFESSNFEPALQLSYPEIRAYVGIGVDDKKAQVRISADPNGIQTMLIRTDKMNEFIEPYSADGSVYAVYATQREKGQLPFSCSTTDKNLLNSVQNKSTENALSSAGKYKTMRLALSCTGEYGQYFGSTVPGILAGMNATMTRVNGICEKDLSVHMNLIANEASIIYFVPSTDPYSPYTLMENWNGELQSNLTSVIGEANYDIGHLFGRTGGGGNAGCIGCVGVDGQKGSGYTSPAFGDVPVGDNFDIDYVTHEMGHQMGAHHTFSCGGTQPLTSSPEDTDVNIEPGSGITVMGYAGITNDATSATPVTDVSNHSLPIFAYRSILEIQTNLNSKFTSATTPINNPVTVSAGADYTIPKLTPFKLVGTGSANINSYVWEENDDAPQAKTVEDARKASIPSITRNNTSTNGPNFQTFNPVSVPERYFPRIETVIAGANSTTWEALSSLTHKLNFTLTGRSYGTPTTGQTGTDAMVVNVSAATSVLAFKVTSQNTTGIVWNQGETQTITWSTNATTISTCGGSANVDIFLSIDGGYTYPITLASSVPNSGSATVTVPNVNSATCRVMVKPTANIYFNINTKDFGIGDLANDNFAFDNFSLYPNPNRGSFNVKFNSTIDTDIKVTVYDMSGREIFSRGYQNNGSFDQNVQLDNVQSGIYLVNVQDGDKKVVKHIVVE